MKKLKEAGTVSLGEPREAEVIGGWRRQKRIDDIAAGVTERVRKVEALIGKYVSIAEMPGVIAFVRGVDRGGGVAILMPADKDHGKPPPTCSPDVLTVVDKPKK